MNNIKNKNSKEQQITLMTCAEVAELLRVKIGTVYSWISYKQLEPNLYRKLGRKPIFIKENVMSWFLAGAELKPRRKMEINNG
ncbi:MAG: helix-turn-helix domain-containing protein [Candidatus Gastranaerophilaceae bacterium]